MHNRTPMKKKNMERGAATYARSVLGQCVFIEEVKNSNKFSECLAQIPNIVRNSGCAELQLGLDFLFRKRIFVYSTQTIFYFVIIQNATKN